MRCRPFILVVLLFLAMLSAGADPALAGPAEDDFAAAAGNYARGRWPLAIEEFEKFLADYPSHASAVEARFLLGEALMQTGQVAAARPHFEAFAAAAPDHRYSARTQFRRGECAYLTGDYVTARTLLSEFHQQHKENELNQYALPYLGDLALKNNEPADAQAFYTEALRKHGGTALADQCRFGLAQSLQMQRRFDDATRFYEFLIARPTSPLADDALLQLGRLQHEQQKYDDALATLSGLIEKYATSDTVPYARYWMGVTQLEKEDYTATISMLEKAATSVDATHPLTPAIRFQLGEAQRRAGRLEEAAAHFQLVLDESPASSWADDARHAQVRLASDTNQHAAVEKLAQAFLKAHAGNPLAYDVRRMQGRAELKQQKFDESIETLSKLVAELDAIAVNGPPDAPLSRRDAKTLADASRFSLGLAFVGAKKYAEADAAIAALSPDEEAEPELAAGVNAVRAAAFIGQEKFAEAITPLREYLRLDPDGPDANQSRAQLAVALAKTGQLPAAQRAYDELTKTFTERNEYLQTTHLLAETAFRAGEKTWARELFTTLADDNNPPQFRQKGLSGKAWCELDLQSPVRSAETFDRLLRDFPESPLVAQAALARGAALEKAQQPDEALAMYTLVINKHPDSSEMPEAIYRAAKLCDQLEQNQQAEVLLRRYIKDYPERTDIDAALYRLAWVLTDQKREAEGREFFALLNSEHPNSRFWPDATYRLATAAMLEGDHEAVTQLVDAMIDSGSTDKIIANAYYLKGQVAAQTGRWSEVQSTMETLLANYPNFSMADSAHYWIAESLYREGKYAQADEQFALLARRTQGQTETWLAIIPLRRAQVLAHNRKWAAAYAMAEPIAEQFPGYGRQYEADYLMGYCLANQARFQDARDAYQRVTDSVHGRRTETAAMAQWNIGETFFHQKDYENAVKAYTRVELLYDFPRWQALSLLQAGKCYEHLSQWSEAAARYQQIVDEFAQTESSTEATQRLATARDKVRQTSGQATEPEATSTLSPPETQLPPLDARGPTENESR